MAGRPPRTAIGLALSFIALSGAFARNIPVDAALLYDLSAAGMAAAPKQSWPFNPLFSDSWVQKNIAVTYAHKTRDGVGAQTMRLMGIYAVAKSLNLQYLHRPIQCVGHVDGRVHFRDSDCGYLNENDRRLMNKIRRMVTLPGNVTEADVKDWENEYLEYVGLTKLTKMIRYAWFIRRPTLFTIEFPTYILQKHPDMYFSVPAFRPEQPSARLVCRAAQAQDKAIAPGRSWLLNALRIAVHFRRGDIAENSRWRDRMLPPAYYVNVVKRIIEVMDEQGCDFTVEVYTETPSTTEGEAELRYLRTNMPAAVMLISTDLSWSWQMMSTADVLIMSNSAFSLSAAIMNPNALNIYFPNAKRTQARIYMDHWFTPNDMMGDMPQEALDMLRKRLRLFKNASEIHHAEGPYGVSKAAVDEVIHPSIAVGYTAVNMAPAPVTTIVRNKRGGVTVTWANLFTDQSSDSSNSGSTQTLNLWPSTQPPANPAPALTAVPTAEDVAPDAAPEAEEQDLLDESSDLLDFDLAATPVSSSAAAGAEPLPAVAAASFAASMPPAATAAAGLLPGAAAPLPAPAGASIPVQPSVGAAAVPAAAAVPLEGSLPGATIPLPAPVVQF